MAVKVHKSRAVEEPKIQRRLVGRAAAGDYFAPDRIDFFARTAGECDHAREAACGSRPMGAAQQYRARMIVHDKERGRFVRQSGIKLKPKRGEESHRALQIMHR